MIGQLITAAFCGAISQHSELKNEWIKLSHIIGGKLPASLVMDSIQKIGDLDILLRCMEDEFVQIKKKEGSESDVMHFHYQMMISKMWIASAYEIIRLFNDRDKTLGEDFQKLYQTLTLVRVSLEKHELAHERKLTEDLAFVKYPPNGDDTDQYSYSLQDPARGHIMPMSVSERGSAMWCVLDIRNKTNIWVERRDLAERFMSCWQSANKAAS